MTKIPYSVSKECLSRFNNLFDVLTNDVERLAIPEISSRIAEVVVIEEKFIAALVIKWYVVLKLLH